MFNHPNFVAPPSMQNFADSPDFGALFVARSPTNRAIWIKIFVVKNFLFIPLVLLLSAQKPVKKPDVHADFQFGSYPWSRTGEAIMKDDLAREVVVAFARAGRSIRSRKRSKSAPGDVSKSIRQARRRTHCRAVATSSTRRHSCRSFGSGIRPHEGSPYARHTQEFTKLIADNWKDIEVHGGFARRRERSAERPRHV